MIKGKILAVMTSAAVAFAMSAAPVCAASSDITKEETVFIVTDSAGKTDEVVVSDHLKNDIETDTIDDASDLTDIENVKGEETFSKGKKDQVIWKAEGNDIFYEGNTSKETPVTMDIAYELDGESVTGNELEGKSGDVKIRINFKNDGKVDVDGQEQTVPFIAITGFIASDDTFTNIEIDHGKVIDDGDKKIVVGMAAPGLAEALDVDLDMYDIDLNDTITITGDAEKFDLQDMMTVVTNSVFQDIDTDEMDLDFDDEVNALNDGAKALVDGTDALYKGIDTLYDNMPELEKGVSALKDGADKLNQGTQKAKNGSIALEEGSKQLQSELNSQMSDMKSGTAQLRDGAKEVLDGMGQLKTGLDGDETAQNPGAIPSLEKIETGLGTASSGIDSVDGSLSGKKDAAYDVVLYLKSLDSTLKGLSAEDRQKLNNKIDGSLISRLDNVILEAEGVYGTIDAVSGDNKSLDSIGDGIDEAKSGVRGVKDGLSNASSSLGSYEPSKGTSQTTLIGGQTVVYQGLKTLNDKLTQATGKDGKLTIGINSLVSGASSLKSGEVQLAGGAKELADGMDSLNDSSGALVDGVSKLDKGSLELSKGMTKFYNEGIRELVDLYENDLKGSVDDLKNLMDAGKEYKIFTKLPNGMDGNVKFIYKTSIY